jgi:hypothetical protein
MSRNSFVPPERDCPGLCKTGQTYLCVETLPQLTVAPKKDTAPPQEIEVAPRLKHYLLKPITSAETAQLAEASRDGSNQT